jgi:hypothetical protein
LCALPADAKIVSQEESNCVAAENLLKSPRSPTTLSAELLSH